MYVSLNVPIINDIKTQVNEAKERLYIKTTRLFDQIG